MKASLIVPTMNRPESLKETLSSVLLQSRFPDELIIVDQSTNEETKRVFDYFSPLFIGKIGQVKYFHQKEPSLVKARNRGVLESDGDIVCFIDDDIILSPEYFSGVMFYFQDPLIGGVSGNVVMTGYAAGYFRGWKWSIRKILLRVFLINSFDGRMTPSTFGFPIYDREIEKTKVVEIFNGYSMNYRREFILKNLPDVWFSGYSLREDVDLSYRISRSARLVMASDIRLIHRHSEANRPDLYELKRMEFRNFKYLFKKFRSSWLTNVLFSYSIIGVFFIDFLEFLSNPFKLEKRDLFLSNFRALPELFR